MTANPVPSPAPRPALLSAFGGEPLSVEALLAFCALPPVRLAQLRELAAPEAWGDEDGVLLRHLAIHVPLAIEQGRYVWNGSELVMRAGQLHTAGGTALYLGWTRATAERWELAWCGERPARIESLAPADLGPWPALDPRFEVVVALDLFRAKELVGLPLVLQNAAIAGAVEWSLRRGLAVRQLRGAGRGYFAPVHLTDRAGAPELAAPIQVQAGRLVVRALIEPRSAYATARALAARREDLPEWLRSAWEPAAPAAEDAVETSSEPSADER